MINPIRLSVWILAVSASLSAVAGPAAANDDVLAGYRKYWAGDRVTAQQILERVLAVQPASLPARFGLLQIHHRQIDDDRALMPDFEKKLDAFIHDADARYDRSRQDSEALFYLANAHILRAQYRMNNNKGMWGAARDGARAKRLIDVYVRRHPEHGDAYFTLGLYNYYVDIAPAFVRVIRLFLFLPGGNRAEGLKQIERAYSQGALFSYSAAMTLMEIYSTYEHKVGEAVRIGERLSAEYPENPDVGMQLAEVYSSPGVEDYARAAQHYEAVLKRESSRPGLHRTAKHRARLGLAAMRQQQWRMDEAMAVLSAGIDENPGTPTWVMPVSLLRRGNYRALVADANAAEDARQVRAEPRWKDYHKAADEQLAWIERRRASGEAAIYAALIPGNRLAAERRWDDAHAVYESVRQQHPNDLQVRYRLALLQFSRGETAKASTAFSTLAAQKNAPSSIRAFSLLYVARAHDLAGRREDAVKVYERIVDDYEKESAAYRARVGLVTPYKRQG